MSFRTLYASVWTATALACSTSAPKAVDDVDILDRYLPGVGVDAAASTDSGSSGTIGLGAPVDGPVGPIDGLAAEMIGDLGCYTIWSMSGEQCSGCGLAWSVDLYVTDDFCGGAVDDARIFQLNYGAAYFDSTYLGIADYGGGYVYWRTYGYGYGYGYDYFIGYAFY